MTAAFSDPFSLPSPDPPASEGALLKAAFSSIVTGVLTPEGSSESSSMTKAVSNSEGSGPRAGVPSLSFGFAFRGLAEGESVRRAVELDLATGAGADFWRACSSAIRESTACLRRWNGQVSGLARLPCGLWNHYLEHCGHVCLKLCFSIPWMGETHLERKYHNCDR